MTVALLKYANRAKVAEALTDAGYSVTRKTVNRWAAGDEMPGIASRMIRELFGHDADVPVETPRWARDLTDEVLTAIEARGGSLIEGAVRQIEAALEPLLSQVDEDPREGDEGPPGGEEAPQPRQQ